MDEDHDAQRRGDRPREREREQTPAPATTPTATTPTRRTVTRTTLTRRTPTGTTRTRLAPPPWSGRLRRSSPDASSRSTGNGSRSSSRAGRRAASTTSSPRRTSSGWSPRPGSGRPASASSRLARPSPGTRSTSLAARRRSRASPTSLACSREFEARRHDRAPGPPPLLAAARALLPAPGGVPRPSRPGQRVLHAARLARPAGPPRHARGDLAPGRGREALARLRARAGAAAEGSALPLRAGRSGRADPGRHPPRRRHDVPAARLAPPGAHVRAPTPSTSPSGSTSAAGSTRPARSWTGRRTTSRSAGDRPGRAAGAPRLDREPLRAQARERFVRSRRPVLDGQLSELRALDASTSTRSSCAATP